MNRLTPAGGGKSALDGMFGRMNTCLKSAVDGGLSHFDARSTCEALEESGGLAATTLLLFKPRRSSRLYASLRDTSLQSVLRSELNADESMTIFKHSGYGHGRRIYASEIAFSLKCKPTASMMSSGVDLLFPIKPRNGSFMTPKALTEQIFNLADKEATKAELQAVRAYFEYRHLHDYVMPHLLEHCPSCEFVNEYDNKKGNVRSVRAEAEQGNNHPSMRQARRISRGVSKAQKDQIRVKRSQLLATISARNDALKRSNTAEKNT